MACATAICASRRNQWATQAASVVQNHSTRDRHDGMRALIMPTFGLLPSIHNHQNGVPRAPLVKAGVPSAIKSALPSPGVHEVTNFPFERLMACSTVMPRD